MYVIYQIFLNRQLGQNVHPFFMTCLIEGKTYFSIALRFFFGGGDLAEAAVQSKFDYIIISEKTNRNQTKRKRTRATRAPRIFNSFLELLGLGQIFSVTSLQAYQVK